MAAESENLDARMEAIRIKNEELEKKHKEIQEDEKLAAKQGALIDLKSQISASNDPSASHPYDKLDLDFDVKDSDKELAKDPSKTQHRRPPPRSEFSDEIPPDPVNFLREDIKDAGKDECDEEKSDQPSQQQRPKNHNNRSGQQNRNRGPRPPRNANQNQQEASGETGDSPPRPKSNQHRPRPHHNNNSSPKHNNIAPVDGQSPQSPQKRPLNPQGLREKRSAALNSGNGESNGQQQPNRGPRRPQNNSKTSPNGKDLGDLKNITVQVTTDTTAGSEIRSVKLTNSSTKKIGSGRVGHGNGSSPQQDEKSTSPAKGDKNSNSGEKKPRNHHRKAPQKPKEFTHPTLENIVITKASVQDRLAKIAKVVDAGGSEVTQ